MREVPFFITEYKARNPAGKPRQRVGIVKEAGTIKVTSKPIKKVSMIVAMLYGLLDEFTQEAYYVVSLDAARRVIGVHMATLGTLTMALAHPREVFKVAVALYARYVITVHNHPSGTPTPSVQDLHLAERIDRAGGVIGIDVIDHLIIGQGTNTWFSTRTQYVRPVGSDFKAEGTEAGDLT